MPLNLRLIAPSGLEVDRLDSLRVGWGSVFGLGDLATHHARSDVADTLTPVPADFLNKSALF
jgi:hypothetical protein